MAITLDVVIVTLFVCVQKHKKEQVFTVIYFSILTDKSQQHTTESPH